MSPLLCPTRDLSVHPAYEQGIWEIIWAKYKEIALKSQKNPQALRWELLLTLRKPVMKIYEHFHLIR